MRRPRTRHFAIVLPLLAVLLVAVILIARDLGTEQDGPPQRAAPHPTPQRTQSARPEGHDLRRAAEGLNWSDYHGVRLPTSPADGPRDRDSGTASGFTRTPRGALLGAINIGVRANAQWGPRVFEPTIGDQVIGGDQRALLGGTRAFYEDQRAQAGIGYGAPLGAAYVLVEAYRWQTYTPEVAAVDLVTAGPGNGGTTARAATRIQLQWDRGDWKVLAPPGGDWGNSATPITDLDGFTVFERE